MVFFSLMFIRIAIFSLFILANHIYLLLNLVLYIDSHLLFFEFILIVVYFCFLLDQLILHVNQHLSLVNNFIDIELAKFIYVLRQIHHLNSIQIILDLSLQLADLVHQEIRIINHSIFIFAGWFHFAFIFLYFLQFPIQLWLLFLIILLIQINVQWIMWVHLIVLFQLSLLDLIDPLNITFCFRIRFAIQSSSNWTACQIDILFLQSRLLILFNLFLIIATLLLFFFLFLLFFILFILFIFQLLLLLLAQLETSHIRSDKTIELVSQLLKLFILILSMNILIQTPHNFHLLITDLDSITDFPCY